MTPEPHAVTPAPLPWTAGEAARLVGGDIDPAHAERPMGSISTDTRTLRPGQWFVALRGPTFDGHRFAADAVRAGAAGLIVERGFDGSAIPGAVPILRVADPLTALGDLAAARRRQWGGPVLAVGGSAGKTTTRRLLAAALARRRRVLEPPGNFNNLIGVPLTLLGLDAAHEIAVLELGMNQPGELRRLAEIAAPSAVLLTHIGLAHIGMFESMQALIDAKMDLLRGSPPGTPAAINAACPRTMLGLGPFVEDRRIVLFTGEEPPLTQAEPQVCLERVRPLAPVGYRFDLRVEGRVWPNLELRLFGRPQVANVAAAAALLLAAGEPVEPLVEALPEFRPVPLRGEWIRAGELDLILDCYNASPPSMLGALRSLADTPPRGRRIVVLADMLELGDQSEPAHEMLLEPLRALAPACFFGLGPRCRALADALAAEGMAAQGFLDRDALTQALRAAVVPGDQIFFKGSHGFALERVAAALAPDAPIMH